jgi:hypothetical protein
LILCLELVDLVVDDVVDLGIGSGGNSLLSGKAVDGCEGEAALATGLSTGLSTIQHVEALLT